MMDQEPDLESYRSRLLDTLIDTKQRSGWSCSDRVQVYVNEQRVGLLEGATADSKLHVQSHERIDTVHLRSEDGVLLGGLSAPEYGFRTSRISLSSDSIELRVHNTAAGGSLNAAFVSAPSLWSRTWTMLAGAVGMISVQPPQGRVIPGIRAVAFTQVLLAMAVAGLVAERVVGPDTSAPAPTPMTQVTRTEAPWAAPLAEVEKLEQQLSQLARMQAKVVETVELQQQGVSQLQQLLSKVSSSQESVVASVLTVQQEIEKRQGSAAREADRPTTRLHASKARVEEGQLEAAIRSLTFDNDRLSSEVVGLEQYNEDLKRKLLSAGLDVSKGGDVSQGRVSARQPEGVQLPPLPQLAEGGASSTQTQPFMFWVTFSEGTSQESIDKWVHEMKGHKGAVNEGWQEVRIVPPTVPPDRFLEQIRGEKIVKAARINP